MNALRKRYILAGSGFLLSFILQTTMLRHIAILEWSPNLILCLVVVSGFLYDEKIGLVYGIVFGLLLDYSTNIYIGPSAMGFVLVYLYVIAIRRVFNHEKLLPELLLAVVSTPLFVFAVWGLNYIAGIPISIFTVLQALPVLIVYNTVLIVLLHLLLVRGVIRHRRDNVFKESFRLRGDYKI